MPIQVKGIGTNERRWYLRIEPEGFCFAVTAYDSGMKGSWLGRVHGNQELTDMRLTFIVFRLLQPPGSDTDLAFSFTWVSKGTWYGPQYTGNRTSNYSAYSITF
jgi:hypothetical protein